MDANVSVWDYYRDGYVDPTFQPYRKVTTPNQQCVSGHNSHNPYKTSPGPDIFPETIRNGWGRTFKLKHDRWPCPTGYIKEGGWCHPAKPEFTPIFATKDGFRPRVNFTAERAPPRRSRNAFDLKSVNPITGQYVDNYASKQSQPTNSGPNKTRSGNSIRARYSQLSVPDSYAPTY